MTYCSSDTIKSLLPFLLSLFYYIISLEFLTMNPKVLQFFQCFHFVKSLVLASLVQGASSRLKLFNDRLNLSFDASFIRSVVFISNIVTNLFDFQTLIA